jgi:endonuclease/exonuclease/phosphatase family metal-dependent hydrolase
MLSDADETGSLMRIASFNLENLELVSRSGVTIEERADILRPQFERLRADILCLQEVNGERSGHEEHRSLPALDSLLERTPYRTFHRVTTSGPSGGVADVHNLVILSRLPIRAHRELRHTSLPPISYRSVTAGASAPAEPILFDRPILMAEIECAGGGRIFVFNIHLRAPLATPIPGQKESSAVWKSVSGWAEGFFLSGLKRSGQALELRLALDALLDTDQHAAIAICGDFNAEDHETPLKIVIGAEEDTGNGLLANRSMVVLDRTLPKDRRFSVLHHGRPQMLDHILISRSLYGRFLTIQAHNETLEDEVIGGAKVQHSLSSFHAPVVAEFAFD